MTLTSLLESLTNDERDFIAGLDYGCCSELHRSALDDVFSSGGLVDFNLAGTWYSYEVIELGKNWLQEGYEREYAACLGIFLKNIESGADELNELEWIVENQSDSISRLPDELKNMISALIDNMINNAKKS
jgi:hypothetical protein